MLGWVEKKSSVVGLGILAGGVGSGEQRGCLRLDGGGGRLGMAAWLVDVKLHLVGSVGSHRAQAVWSL